MLIPSPLGEGQGEVGNLMSKYVLKYPHSHVALARKLRREITDAERKLWSLLRNNRIGVHFRRQVPFGPYILDFLAVKAKLVVGLDGGQHFIRKNQNYDVSRDAYIRKQGFTVLRFSDREFLTNPQGVMQTIYDELYRKDK